MSIPSEDMPVVSDASLSQLKAYAVYPFATDDTYQQGLTSILAGGAYDEASSPDVKEEIIRRTRVFYYNHVTGSSITMDEARVYEHSLRGGSGSAANLHISDCPSAEPETSQTDDTRVLTFAELQQLIESGKVDQIPNNRSIPEKLNDAPPSESTTPARKKPWELAAAHANDETGSPTEF